MNIVLFSHPDFLGSKSMSRFCTMLYCGYKAAGHSVEIWSPTARVSRIAKSPGLRKWAGYFDQYVLFPIAVRQMLQTIAADTLFVFCDQALGPWVPIVKARPSVVHVHDLLALRSALNEFPENPTKLTGKIYQRYIRRGFRHARHFISVSNKTRADLHKFGGVVPLTSDVVYNGMNFAYSKISENEAIDVLSRRGLTFDRGGMLLHVGSGQWYKNLRGVIALYCRYVQKEPNPLPLLCIGPEPNKPTRDLISNIPKRGRVRFVQDFDSAELQASYSLARVFLFPSLEEGFGWPLIEAQACGCPVITTGSEPMSEVAGPAAHYLPRLQAHDDIDQWAENGATLLCKVLTLNESELSKVREQGRNWVTRFEATKALNAYMQIYSKVMRDSIVDSGS